MDIFPVHFFYHHRDVCVCVSVCLVDFFHKTSDNLTTTTDAGDDIDDESRCSIFVAF